MKPFPQAIQLSELTKDFPLMEKGHYLRAVDKLTLNIPEGSVFGLLGPNGSGKSTTIRMLLGLSEPSSGGIQIFGGSAKDPAVRRRIGYLPDAPYYHKFLTGRELLRFFGRLLGIPKTDLERQSFALLSQFGLADAIDRKLGAYSKGMLQRLGFAQAMLGDPEILILDEPTAGVDPVGASEVGVFVRSLRERGKTVLLCSHLLTQVQGLCDAVGIMNRGRLLAAGSIETLLPGGGNSRLAIDGLTESDLNEIARLAESKGGRAFSIGDDLEDIFRKLVIADDKSGGAP
ncbi:ABC transporter ATP-binding protein [Pelagicoccus sp. SDUM812002]|uniref:ABC transporter ATP-binding protein n=1 Tax=Pelagicoccus sp. SDUM812002 TaxID=3041266 RepID=UPI00280CD8D6|nr:ABC transporter ATP-binding protein [Pelagicoccus sp. SDUM812002]MDQ8185222.1 ABC transporter ATP-binding protein [Pelagicoccus sp. SDUM812002]